MLEPLRDLYNIFSDAGYKLVLVGGCVRDSLLGLEPKDIDLATSATPDEMMDLFNNNDIRCIPTGLDHGTVTVVIDDIPYEITTYRIDAETDGRRATVEYTRSLREDLQRRDLTFNAIAMDFDGNIIDPFNGVTDLETGIVRFVGNPKDRIEEDYLRILRFFRFYGRFGSTSIDSDTLDSIIACANGLKEISVERIWMEMAKIITGPNAHNVMSIMNYSGVLNAINMPRGDSIRIKIAQELGVTNAASVLGYYITDEVYLNTWKLSNEENGRVNFITKNFLTACAGKEDFLKELLVNSVPRDWVLDLARLSYSDVNALMNWDIPIMPVNGNDLIEMGIEPGTNMGRLLAEMKKRWVKSDYNITKAELLDAII